MIVVKTKIKKIAEKCSKCVFSSVEGTYGFVGERYCVVSNNKCCPYEYNKEKRNWEYTKPNWCPLEELKNQ